MNGEIQNFRPDVTFPCSVQKKTRHSCSLNWEWTRMTQVFCRNKLPSWKQSYRWAEKQSRGYLFLVPIKSHLCMILKKAIVYDFSKKLLSLNSLEMNKLTINGENQNFRPDVTFPCSVLKKTRHSCSLNWECCFSYLYFRIDWHLCGSSHLSLTFGSQLHKSQRETHQLIPISNSTNYQLEMLYFFQNS